MFIQIKSIFNFEATQKWKMNKQFLPTVYNNFLFIFTFYHKKISALLIKKQFSCQQAVFLY